MSQVHALQSVPLQYILQKQGAPKVIDYFSLDVEGAETRVLKYFPFEKWTFLALTIERPTPLINRILLEDLGYLFVRNIYTPQVKEQILTQSASEERVADRIPPRSRVSESCISHHWQPSREAAQLDSPG